MRACVCLCEWVSEWVSEHASEWACEWVSEHVSEWVCRQVSEHVSEWVSTWGRECFEWGWHLHPKRWARPLTQPFLMNRVASCDEIGQVALDTRITSASPKLLNNCLPQPLDRASKTQKIKSASVGTSIKGYFWIPPFSQISQIRVCVPLSVLWRTAGGTSQ